LLIFLTREESSKQHKQTDQGWLKLQQHTYFHRKKHESDCYVNYQPMNPTWLERIKDGVTIPKVIISF